MQSEYDEDTPPLDPEVLKKLAEHLLVELSGARRPHKPMLNDE